MRKLLILLFLCYSLTLSGTIYYVSSAGNDAANGLTESTSWKSITKVNSAFSTFKSGDKVLFKRGDTFYGSLTVTVSGSSGNPIIIGAYGTGKNPILSGFTTLTSWSNYSTNIWRSSVSCPSTPNILLIDGANTVMGRSPISNVMGGGWPSNSPHFDSATNTSLTDADLASYPNLVGAEVVVRQELWASCRRVITTHSGSTIGFGSLDYTPKSENGIWPCYFIQNDISTLNLDGEWCYRGGYIYIYHVGSPSGHTIQVPTLNNVIDVNGKNYITFDGISVQGSNKTGIGFPSSSYITIQNCDISFNGSEGVFTTASSNTTVTNSTFDNNNNCSIHYRSDSGCTYSSITYNTITNNGLIIGQDGGDTKSTANEVGIAIVAENAYSTIEHNTITDCGGMGIRWGGQYSKVKYNYLDHALQNVVDAGAIYSYRFLENMRKYGSSDPYSEGEVAGGFPNKECAYNIVVNIVRCKYGWSYDGAYGAVAMYFDGACHAYIHHNIIGNIEGRGIYLNANHGHYVQYNTIYNAIYGIWVATGNNTTAWFGGEAGFSSLASNHNIQYNTVVSNTNVGGGGSSGGPVDRNYVIEYCTKDNSGIDCLKTLGTINNNYYACITRSTDYIAVWYNGFSTFTTNNLEGIKSTLGYDVNSTISSTIVTDVTKVRFEYNATNQNKIVTLDAGYIDVKGTKYSGNITLLPYTSVVLLPDPNSSAAPATLSYINSAVGNSSPTLLELNYNIALANIVPTTSSFSVLVNSVARTVNTIFISGTMVQLTLASRIISGDVVTVSYTKPATNPIQTASGGLAGNITNQQVINNCINSAPTATIIAPLTNNSFTAPANISITADASDSDGSVSMVEFYNGSTKLGSKSTAPYSFTWANIAAGTYSLTVIATDNLNEKTTSVAISISVINNTSAVNIPPVVTISNPKKGNKFEKLSTITIDAVASDPDGTVSKLEFYSGAVKLVELTSAPYTYTWKNVAAGSYSITAVATDNLNETTISLPVEFLVRPDIKYDANSDIINLYPNPNNGHFSIEFINPMQNDKSVIIITDMAGKQVYNGPVLKEETKKQIDISNSRSGIYVMLIMDKEILVTKKFIMN